ncbi:MAG: ABC transporter ATP-binding protein [Capsulimonadales bacterium]|nr:ABC transporter ATP-binding protein [Capsulimonadales bacterium]
MANTTHSHSGSASGHAGDHTPHATPVARLSKLGRLEKNDLTVLIVYTVVAGLLALIVPLTAQALVNIIAANVFAQPLVVLSLLVLGSLLLVGLLQVAKMRLVEVLQQRVFARTSLEMAYHLLRVRSAALRDEYAPELVNRFFDILTVQKALSKLLFDGLAALLQAGVGLILLAVYNPLLFGFDILLLLCMAIIFGVLGWGGLRTSIKESKEKYHVADWLEEIARCHASFKLHGNADYLVSRADDLILRYIKARNSHFSVLVRQSAGYYLFQAVASAGILAAGGWLVINRELTLGQLVAAQIVVVSLLAALEKIIRQIDQVFDLLTGLDKIGHVLDLATERTNGNPLIGMVPASETGITGASIRLQDVCFSYQPGMEILTDVSFEVAPGERVCLVGTSGSGKTTITSLLCGLEEPSKGIVAIDESDIREWNLTSLRRTVSRVGTETDIFDGTITDNVTIGRTEVTPTDVREALGQAQMTPDLSRMPQGTQTMLVSGGQNISHGQAQRILIARAIVGKPRVLILDEAFNAVEEATANEIRDALFDPAMGWTIFAVSHNPETVARCSRVLILSEGRVVEEGAPMELALKRDSRFCCLFPTLGRTLRNFEEPMPATGRATAGGSEGHSRSDDSARRVKEATK